MMNRRTMFKGLLAGVGIAASKLLPFRRSPHRLLAEGLLPGVSAPPRKWFSFQGVPVELSNPLTQTNELLNEIVWKEAEPSCPQP